ncbi:hypothetical protein [Chryseobacterium sp. CT-SW4]|uniref:hypothetical protein n=1 Tax=Chryseobacterium sp. SW-1 TaxID=3157343 RepID=UPI003B016B32
MDISEEEARVVSLEEILEFDHTLKEILIMVNGSHAWRENINGKWKIDKSEDGECEQK